MSSFLKTKQHSYQWIKHRYTIVLLLYPLE